MAIVAMTSLALGTAVARPSDLDAAKAATGRFHSLSVAGHAGYGLPPAGVPLHECISNGSQGAMGFHYINGNLLDTTLDPTKPEALVYTPDAKGKLHLGALEFVVFLTLDLGAPSAVEVIDTSGMRKEMYPDWSIIRFEYAESQAVGPDKGIETAQARLAYLRRPDTDMEACTAVQGYLVGKPLPIAAYAETVGRESARDGIASVA